jgi:spermidine/putrescine transport system ATP-binding protein
VTTAPDVELTGVSKSYDRGATWSVRELDLRVGEGEFFSILGPSGCGKTTTLRMIGGIEIPDAGTVAIRGRDVTTLPPNRRPSNMVFQRLALFPHLTVEANIAYGPKVKGIRGSRLASLVDEMVGITSLEAFRGRYPGELSGGQQQRVAIARALANEPAVLLLDEPLSSLDLKLRTQMQAALKQIQTRSGTTFVYVTHDQGEALAMSDRLAVMNAGRVEQIGTPAEVYGAPRTRFVADFIGEMNFLDPALVPAAWLGGRTADGMVVAIRPEDLAPADGVGLAGTIAGQVFQGSFVRVQVVLGSGASVVMMTDPARARELAVGSPISLHSSPDRILLLPHQNGSDA